MNSLKPDQTIVTLTSTPQSVQKFAPSSAEPQFSQNAERAAEYCDTLRGTSTGVTLIGSSATVDRPHAIWYPPRTGDFVGAQGALLRR
jgi:hypothetical protein